jgi:preprotein translocase subunit YajC
MKKIITITRWVKLLLLFVLALAGGFMMIQPKRNEQDYDNEIKTELVEGAEDQFDIPDNE